MEQQCEDCGSTGEKVKFAPCPYAFEVHNDKKELWLCDLCAIERAMDLYRSYKRAMKQALHRGDPAYL